MYKYAGNGSYIVGIPARDLTNKEAEQYGINRLVASGLYEAPKRSRRKPKDDDKNVEAQENDNG